MLTGAPSNVSPSRSGISLHTAGSAHPPLGRVSRAAPVTVTGRASWTPPADGDPPSPSPPEERAAAAARATTSTPTPIQRYGGCFLRAAATAPDFFALLVAMDFAPREF